MTASFLKQVPKHIKGSKERLFVMTQTHNLQICRLCVCVAINNFNKRSFEPFMFGSCIPASKQTTNVFGTPAYHYWSLTRLGFRFGLFCNWLHPVPFFFSFFFSRFFFLFSLFLRHFIGFPAAPVDSAQQSERYNAPTFAFQATILDWWLSPSLSKDTNAVMRELELCLRISCVLCKWWVKYLFYSQIKIVRKHYPNSLSLPPSLPLSLCLSFSHEDDNGYDDVAEQELSLRAAGIAQCERRTRDWKVAGSNPCRSGGRILFSRVNFLCCLLFRYPFHPSVTTVARKRSWSFCQKRRWQVTTK